MDRPNLPNKHESNSPYIWIEMQQQNRKWNYFYVQ